MKRSTASSLVEHVSAQHLDRDALVEREVRARRDDAHSAVAEDRVDAILAEQDPPEHAVDLDGSKAVRRH